MEPQRQKTILLVEDEIVIAALEKRQLESEGYRVIHVVSGESAIEHVTAGPDPVDLILMDIDLGKGIDGTQAAREILRTHTIPVLFVSSHSEKDFVRRTEEMTSYGYVLKDAGEVVLLASIKMAFRLHESNRKLAENAHQFEMITSTSIDGYYALDLRGRFIEVNEAYCAMTGYSRRELLQLSIVDVEATEDEIEAKRHGDRIVGQGSEIFESRHRCKDGRVIDVAVHATFIPHEQRIIAFVNDSTERKKAEREIAKVNRLYAVTSGINQAIIRVTDPTSLYDAVCRTIVEQGGFRLSWIGVLDPETLDVRLASHAGVDEGYMASARQVTARDVPQGRGPTGTAIRERRVVTCDMIATDAIMEPWRADALRRGFQSSIALPIFCCDRVVASLTIYAGETAFFRAAEVELLTNVCGDIGFALELFEKAAERARIERALEEESTRRRIMFDQSPYGIVILEPGSAKLVEFNARAHEQLGYSREEFAALTLRDIEAQESDAETRRQIKNVLASGRADFETKHKAKSGEIRDIAVTAQYVVAGGRPVYHCVWHDITSRKRAEESLIESENRFRSLFEYSPNAIFLTDPETFVILDCNPKACDMNGYTRSELIGQSINMLHTDDITARLHDPEVHRQHMEALRHGGRTMESVHRRKDGTMFPIETSMRLITTGGREITLGIDRDISERKQMEGALKESELMLRAILENSSDAIGVHVAGKWAVCNPAAVRLFGVSSPDDLLGTPIIDVLAPTERDRVTDYVRGRLQGVVAPRSYVTRGLRRDGTEFDMDVQLSMFMLDGVQHVLVILRDISERHRAEEALRESEERFRSLFDRSNAVMLLVEPDSGAIIDGNPAAVTYYGYPRDMMRSMNIADINLLSREEIAARMAQARKEELNYFIFPHKLASGEVRSVEIRSSPIEVQGRTVLFSIAHDITERRQAEEKLRESEARYHTLFDTAIDGIIILDAYGRIVEVNEAFAASHGYAVEEMKQKHISEFNKPDDVPRVRERMRHLLEGGTLHFEVDHVHRDGHVFTLDAMASAIRLNGQPYIVSYHRDLSERKRAEREIGALLAEKELLLKEVHHRIKNNMNTIRSLLSLQGSALSDPSARAALKDSEERVRSMMLLYDKLYRSQSFVELGMEEYLSSLVHGIVDNFPQGDRVTVTLTIEQLSIDPRRLSAIGMIVNELVTNIMKYAFVGRSAGEIVVTASRTNGHCTLIVKDNGVGLPQTFTHASSSGFGLQLVQMLADQLDGTIRVDQDGGAKWTLECAL